MANRVGAMRMRGVEPPRAEAHRHLKPARLPIPPHPRSILIIKDFGQFVKDISAKRH